MWFLQIRTIYSTNTHPFLHSVEIVDYNTDKEIKHKERPNYDENHKVEVGIEVRFEFWLLVDLQKKFIFNFTNTVSKVAFCLHVIQKTT